MISDLFIGNFGTEGFERTIFVPAPELPAPVVEKKGRAAPGRRSAERVEFERLIAVILGGVREFPEAFGKVMAVIQAERKLCMA